MSRRKKITIIVLIIAVIIFGLLLFLEFGEKATDSGQPPEEEGPIFPFATTSDFFTGEDGSDGIDTDSEPAEEPEQPDLWKISDDPVAGSAWVNTNTQENEHAWFVKQSNGFVYSADPQTRKNKQLTDTRIPQAREAIISPSGETIIYRYLDDEEIIQTYKANITPTDNNTDTPYEVSGSFLPTNIYEITLSPDGSQIFYLQEANNHSVGVLYNVSANSQQQVFNSDVTSWRARFSEPNTVTLFTPPADDITGYGYRLNLQTGKKEKITEGTALQLKGNIGGNKQLVTKQTIDGFVTNPLTATNTNTTAQTFTDKCSWANTEVFFCGVPQNTIPTSINAWYQGREQFRDSLYVFNVTESNRDQLFDSEQIDKASSDMIDISTSNSFRHTIFTDRTTGDLWGYEL